MLKNSSCFQAGALHCSLQLYYILLCSHCRRNFSWQSLAEAELKSLQQALDILFDAEKQFMFSSGVAPHCSLQLYYILLLPLDRHKLLEHIKEHTNSKMSACGSDMSLATPESSSSSTAYTDRQYSSPIGYPFVSQKQNAATNRLSGDVSPDKLDEIWRRCQSSHPMTRELLTHGKLVSIEETNVFRINCSNYNSKAFQLPVLSTKWGKDVDARLSHDN